MELVERERSEFRQLTAVGEPIAVVLDPLAQPGSDEGIAVGEHAGLTHLRLAAPDERAVVSLLDVDGGGVVSLLLRSLDLGDEPIGDPGVGRSGLNYTVV